MIRSLTACSVLALGLAGIASAETRTYEVGSFTKIDISSGLDLSFQTGGSQSITAENRNGDFSDLEVDVKNDTLILKRKKRVNWGWGKRESYDITVTAPVISALEVSSGADAVGAGMSGDTVSIDVSSGADATVTDVTGSTVNVETSSGSDATVSGTCETVYADASSGSDLNARSLICSTGYADASSGSDITIHASLRVSAEASSGADVDVYGSPGDVTTDKSSGGDVSIKG